jgi:ribosome-associated heat shock protein Hsp15
MDAHVRPGKRRLTRIPEPAAERTRLDKWLWAARFYRTRSLAAAAIDAGQVRVDGERAKPAYGIRAAIRISVRKQALTWTVEVLDVSDRRGSATQAAALYRETAESIALREKTQNEQKVARAQAAAQTPGRPTKRDRRRLEDFLNEP